MAKGGKRQWLYPHRGNRHASKEAVHAIDRPLARRCCRCRSRPRRATGCPDPGVDTDRPDLRDRDGQGSWLVPDLLKEDFEVYDNGKLQTLTNFYNEPQPITVVVMLDTSGSMTLALDLVKQGAEEFVLRMLPQDRGKVGAFNDKLEVHPGRGCRSPVIVTG